MPQISIKYQKPISQVIDDIRDLLVKARDQLEDIRDESSAVKDKTGPVEGLLTCGLIALYRARDEMREFEIRQDNQVRGQSLYFAPRGIGTDNCPGCFVCGTRVLGGGRAMSNISAFVKSKEEGETIVQWFTGVARLDFRPSEPNWIQVKVGVCGNHEPELAILQKTTGSYNCIRRRDITDIIANFEREHKQT